jgi:hypothetical protein
MGCEDWGGTGQREARELRRTLLSFCGINIMYTQEQKKNYVHSCVPSSRLDRSDPAKNHFCHCSRTSAESHELRSLLSHTGTTLLLRCIPFFRNLVNWNTCIAKISSYLLVTRNALTKNEQKDINTNPRVARTVYLNLYCSLVRRAGNCVHWKPKHSWVKYPIGPIGW